MGSYSLNTSVAKDQRQAITDNAFGFSTSGDRNKTAFEGHVFDNNGDISLTTLDGGAIEKAFDFANNSLSVLLSSNINQQKDGYYEQNTVQDTAADAVGEVTETEDDKAMKRQIIQGLVVAGLSWFFFYSRRPR